MLLSNNADSIQNIDTEQSYMEQKLSNLGLGIHLFSGHFEYHNKLFYTSSGDYCFLVQNPWCDAYL